MRRPHARIARALVTMLVPLVFASACAIERERTPSVVHASRIHADGIVDPTSPDFHGTLLKSLGWNFDLCKRCHGDDLAGGAAKVSCTSCHGAPTDCATCHARTLSLGAHATHLPAGTSDFTACGRCHTVPSDWRDPGHIFLADGTIDPPSAEVTFSGLASLKADGTAGTAARWDAASRTCVNVYCHGGAFPDAAATNRTPSWDAVGTGQAACGTCHGKPPASHASGACPTCHGAVTDASGTTIADASRHLNGVVNFGRNAGTDPNGCDTCHGSPGSPAPPSDLYGQTATTLLGVGAHQTHLKGRYTLSNPVACSDCHIVPSTRDAAGHFDSSLPAEVTFSGRATLNGAAPVWSRDSATCANVYCHGGGPLFNIDQSPGRVLAPVWTKADGLQIVCGSCHGVPPADGYHNPAWPLAQCVNCHGKSIDGTGNFVFVNGSTTHIDGVVNGN